MQKFSSTLIAIIAFIAITNVRADFTEFGLTVHSSPAIDIEKVDVTPMPIIQPGEAFLTMHANLKRPINVIKVTLNILRAVSGIKLPIRCYKVEDVFVGSCSYEDLCIVLKTMLPSFKPETCPLAMATYGIDCNCPFKIPAGRLDIVRERLELPDASQSIASFMASGDFTIKLDTQDNVGDYASLTIGFTVKQKPASG